MLPSDILRAFRQHELGNSGRFVLTDTPNRSYVSWSLCSSIWPSESWLPEGVYTETLERCEAIPRHSAHGRSRGTT